MGRRCQVDHAWVSRLRRSASVFGRQMKTETIHRGSASGTNGARVQTGRHRVRLLVSHNCSPCHVMQQRRGAGVQNSATPRSLVNGCQRTPPVDMATAGNGNPSRFGQSQKYDGLFCPAAAERCFRRLGMMHCLVIDWHERGSTGPSAFARCARGSSGQTMRIIFWGYDPHGRAC
jgi:hypothetical protein